MLVVDDGSSDRTMEEAEAAGVLVVRHPDLEQVRAAAQAGNPEAQEQLALLQQYLEQAGRGD